MSDLEKFREAEPLEDVHKERILGRVGVEVRRQLSLGISRAPVYGAAQHHARAEHARERVLIYASRQRRHGVGPVAQRAADGGGHE